MGRQLDCQQIELPSWRVRWAILNCYSHFSLSSFSLHFCQALGDACRCNSQQQFVCVPAACHWPEQNHLPIFGQQIGLSLTLFDCLFKQTNIPKWLLLKSVYPNVQSGIYWNAYFQTILCVFLCSSALFFHYQTSKWLSVLSETEKRWKMPPRLFWQNVALFDWQSKSRLVHWWFLLPCFFPRFPFLILTGNFH